MEHLCMKKFLGILFLSISIILLISCAKPTVVTIVLPGDNELNCEQLENSIAESENVRRRTEREKADSSRYAITNFARSILSVADNLNRALESVSEEACEGSEELKNLYIGIEMTGKEIDNVYEQFGIKAIEALGKKFDHNFHQAMFEVEDLEQPAGVVVQQVQKGYVIHERLLRPAMVGVAKKKGESAES